MGEAPCNGKGDAVEAGGGTGAAASKGFFCSGIAIGSKREGRGEKNSFISDLDYHDAKRRMYF